MLIAPKPELAQIGPKRRQADYNYDRRSKVFMKEL